VSETSERVGELRELLAQATEHVDALMFEMHLLRSERDEAKGVAKAAMETAQIYERRCIEANELLEEVYAELFGGTEPPADWREAVREMKAARGQVLRVCARVEKRAQVLADAIAKLNAREDERLQAGVVIAENRCAELEGVLRALEEGLNDPR
jgi:chromosome segregation ATPase